VLSIMAFKVSPCAVKLHQQPFKTLTTDRLVDNYHHGDPMICLLWKELRFHSARFQPLHGCSMPSSYAILEPVIQALEIEMSRTHVEKFRGFEFNFASQLNIEQGKPHKVVASIYPHMSLDASMNKKKIACIRKINIMHQTTPVVHLS